MKKPEKNVTKVSEHLTTDVAEPIIANQEVTEEVKAEKKLVDIDTLTDADLLAIIQERKAKRAEIGAIHSVSVPTHVLMKKSAVVVPDVDVAQTRMQQELAMLQTQVSTMRGK